MIVKTIVFRADRKPNPSFVHIGFESDNMVERLVFVLPSIHVQQTATLMIDGKYVNMAMLAEESGRYYIDLTAELVGAPGQIDAYITIDAPDGKVWNSAPFALVTGDLPDVDGAIQEHFPDAIQQMRQEIAGHRAEMQDQSKAVQEAAGRAEKAAGDISDTLDGGTDGQFLGNVNGEPTWMTLGDGSGGGSGIAKETDPTVPAWAKQPEKPTYTAEEVGAQPKGDYASRGDIDRLTEEIGDYDGTAYVDVTIEPNVVLNNTTGLPGPTSADTRAGIMTAITLKTGSVIDLSNDKYAFGYNLFVDSVLAFKSDWTTGSATIDRDCDVVFHFKKADNSSFTEADISDLSDNFTIIAHGVSLSENVKHLEQKTREIAADAENVFELNEAINKNKWSYGDIVASAPNGFVLFPVNIPAGEYAFSGVITTTDTDDERFSAHFLDADNAYVAQISIIKSNNGSRFAATVTLSRDVAAMRLYAGYGASGSKNETATFTQLQLETGRVATDYVAYGDSAASFVSGAYTAMRQSDIAVGLFNLFRLPLYHHLNQETNNVGIPAQSLYDIHYAKSLGFDLIEVNEHKCSDGVFVCKHGLQGALGKGIKAIDNEDYSATLFSAVTSEWLRENIRYDSSIGKYCGFIPTLDEFCRECRKLNMAIKISSHEALQIVRKYLPDNMVWLTNNNRKDFKGTIEYIWENTDDIDECIETCKTIGAPLNIVIKAGQFDSTSDEMVAELCAKAHENGFTVGTVYPTANTLLRARELGVDVSGSTGNDVNLLEHGNAKNITSLDSSELALNNATYNADNDTITISENGTITIPNDAFRKGIASIRLRYSGTLTIKDGVTNFGLTEYASTEEKEVQMSIVLQPYGGMEYTKWLVITANAETTIYDIDVHCSYI